MTWLSLFAAPEQSDPLVWLLKDDEKEIDWVTLARMSYSELSAYILLLVRFAWERLELAKVLGISIVTFHARVIRAADRTRVQRSIFDGIDFIDPDFVAPPGWSRPARKQRGIVEGQQPLF